MKYGATTLHLNTKTQWSRPLINTRRVLRESNEMPESQHTEYKQSWRDEYLKWVSGFANAEGGVMVIGRDDADRVVGVSDAKKLLEDIPNKVQDLLGILVEVNLN